MKSRNHMVLCLFTLVVMAGCASTKVTSRNELVSGPLPMPDEIWVYDFAATPTDVPGDSAFAGQYAEHYPPQTAEQIATGRRLGHEMAEQLVQQILDMGMPAALAGPSTKPQVNDIVLRGYLISYNEGDAAQRIVIGFGSGKSDLRVALEGFQMTAGGLRKLGSGSTNSAGADTPGMDLGALSEIATHNPAGLILSSGFKAYGQESGDSTIQGRVKQTVKEIADVLKQRFEQQGWIS